jgi:hypothetical protein
MPTKERHAQSGEGFQMENLAPPGAPPVVRAIEKSPLTSPAGRELAIEQRDQSAPGRRQQMTFLDRALDDCEVHALFRFVVGTMIGEARMRLSGSDDRQPVYVKSDGQGRIPFSDAERQEIGARQFVYSKLPQESQRDIEILTDQIMPRDRKFYISPVDFGRIVSRSTDERVARGAFIGTFKKLAHHVNQLYVEWEVIQFRRLREIKALRNSKDAALIELSTGLPMKAIAN